MIVLYLDIGPVVADMYRRTLGMPRGTNIQVVAVDNKWVGMTCRSLALDVCHEYCLEQSRSVN